MSGMILNWSQPKFAAQSVANDMLPVQGNNVCSNLNQTAQQLHMAECKCLKIMSGMIWIDCNQSLQPNLWQMKCNVWKQWSDQCWQDKFQFSIWRFFEQIVFVNNHLLCYWPSIHQPIFKICPKFQVLSSHFFKVNGPETLCSPWAILCGTEPVRTLTHALFILLRAAALSVFFFFLDFVSGNLALTGF